MSALCQQPTLIVKWLTGRVDDVERFVGDAVANRVQVFGLSAQFVEVVLAAGKRSTHRRVSGAYQRGLGSKIAAPGLYSVNAATFLEEVRMRHIQIGLFLATIVLSLTASATPSAAVIIYPWCANYLGRYTMSCGSTSLKQCLATQAGNGGSCDPNPYYEPYPPPPTYSPPITRPGSGYRK